MQPWRDWPIKTINLNDRNYPQRLKQVKSAPPKLYYRGQWSRSIFDHCLAVVGTRRMSSYSEAVLRRLMPELVAAKLTIVSGFMYGVDSLAHRLCLEFSGKTIAVFGSGLNRLLPAENDSLYTQILNSGGLVLSEYEPEFKARLWSFPQRNRIVAGLSQAVLVVEAGEKSGSLITAKLAQKQGKKVLAVPGPVHLSGSKGTNWLIQNGAKLVVEAGDILAEFNLHPRGEIRQLAEHLGGVGPHLGGVLEQQIVAALQRESLEIDELSRLLKVGIVELGQTLSLMSLAGLVTETSGHYSLN